nr:recombinase family protein [Flavonifractor plautii]
MVPEEAAVVNRIAGLYLDGLSYQKLADLLNQKNIPFSQEAPAWDKHKVKRLLENPRYTGQKGYPAILDGGTFHCVQSRIQEKTAKQTPKAERPALKLVSRLHCAACGAALHRMGGRNRQSDTLYLKCVQCGAVITMRDEVLLDEIARQTAEQERPERISYQPSGEVVRLTNAINRGLEHPDDPQEIVSLILQGAAARYACFPDITEQIDRPLDVCLDHIRLAVSHINLSEEGTVEAAFPSGHRERTEHGADCTAACADHPRQEGY